jgi:hypothetical protein
MAEAVITVSETTIYTNTYVLNLTPLPSARNSVIEETIQYRNEEIEATRWDYSLGQSETLPQNKVSEMLRKKIDELSKYGPLVLVSTFYCGIMMDKNYAESETIPQPGLPRCFS